MFLQEDLKTGLNNNGTDIVRFVDISLYVVAYEL